MEKINFRNINEYKNKHFALYNQLMINKALEEGHIEFLPVKKISNKSIGEWIELKYRQFHNEEFDRYFHNGWLDDYDHLISNKPKITQKESLLYIREFILKTCQEDKLNELENLLEIENITKDSIEFLIEEDEILIKKLKIKGRMKKWVKNMK